MTGWMTDFVFTQVDRYGFVYDPISPYYMGQYYDRISPWPYTEVVNEAFTAVNNRIYPIKRSKINKIKILPVHWFISLFFY